MALVLVTGASTGLGHDTADALADVGHDVVVHARNPARITEAADTDRWKGVADFRKVREQTPRPRGLTCPVRPGPR